MDLGECPKVHSEALRADFEEANKKKNYGFEKEVEFYFFVLFIFVLLRYYCFTVYYWYFKADL